jgi:hypothetical protein
METKKTTKPYPLELRERAVRLVREHEVEGCSRGAPHFPMPPLPKFVLSGPIFSGPADLGSFGGVPLAIDSSEILQRVATGLLAGQPSRNPGFASICTATLIAKVASGRKSSAADVRYLYTPTIEMAFHHGHARSATAVSADPSHPAKIGDIVVRDHFAVWQWRRVSANWMRSGRSSIKSPV